MNNTGRRESSKNRYNGTALVERKKNEAKMITGPIIPQRLPEGSRPKRISKGTKSITPANSEEPGDKTLPIQLVSNRHQSHVNKQICIRPPGIIIKKMKPTIEE